VSFAKVDDVIVVLSKVLIVNSNASMSGSPLLGHGILIISTFDGRKTNGTKELYTYSI
jgi:hypothetical protein